MRIVNMKLYKMARQHVQMVRIMEGIELSVLEVYQKLAEETTDAKASGVILFKSSKS